MGLTASDLSDWTLEEVKGVYLYYKDECLDFGLDRDTFEQLLHRLRPNLASVLWKKLDPLNSGLISSLECIAGLAATACKARIVDKVDTLFSLFDFQECSSVTYDELVILASSVLSGAVKVTGKGNLPDDVAMEKLIDHAYLEADKDLSAQFTLSDFRRWLARRFGGLEEETLQVTDVLTQFDLLDEPNALPDKFVDMGYVDDAAIRREELRSARVVDQTGASGMLSLFDRCRWACERRAAEVAAAGGGEDHSTMDAWSENGHGAQEARLSLWCAHGYSGWRARNNVVWCGAGEVAYPVACMVVVARPFGKDIGRTQRFYRRHRQCVLSLCAHPDGKVLASGEEGRAPQVHVWEVEGLQTLCVLKGMHHRGVAHVAFSPSGKYLATCGDAVDPLLVVYEWKEGLGSAVAQIARCDFCVFDICWVKEDFAVATVGSKVVLWEGVTQPGQAMRRLEGEWGRKATRQQLLSVKAFKGMIATGGAGGQVYTWARCESGLLCQGGPTLHETAVTSLWTDGECLVSAGKDGIVKVLDSRLLTTMEYKLPGGDMGITQQVSAVCCTDTRNRIALGTAQGEVYEMGSDGYHQLLTSGHWFGKASALDAHPNAQEFVSAGYDGTVRMWELDAQATKACRRFDASYIGALAYSPDGQHITLGFGGRFEGGDDKSAGTFYIVSSSTLNTEASFSDFNDPITTIVYSSDGGLLALGCQTGSVYVYNAAGDIAFRRCVISGPASPVVHMAFSVDVSYVRVVGAGLGEVVHADVTRGQTVGRDDVDISGLQWAVPGPVHALEARLTADGGVIIGQRGSACDEAVTGYRGHKPGSAVTCKLTHDQRHVLTLGAADQSLLIWRVELCEREVEYAAKLEQQQAEAAPSSGTVAAGCRPTVTQAHVVAEHGGFDFVLQDDAEPTKFSTVKPWMSAIHEPNRRVDGCGEAPLRDLDLEWVHGFAGTEVPGGLTYGVDAETLVYLAGRVGVVHSFRSPQSQTQSYLLGHLQRDPSCMALNASRTHAAVGQRDSSTVYIWDTATARLIHDFDSGLTDGISHVAFHDDELLAVFGRCGTQHTLIVIDCRAYTLNASGTSQPAALGLAWLSKKTLVTCGASYVTEWTLSTEGLLEQRRCTFGHKGMVQPVLCVAAVNEYIVVTGQSDGSVYLWEGRKVTATVSAAHEAPVSVLCCQNGLIFSGGLDGTVRCFMPQLEDAHNSSVLGFEGAIVHISPHPQADGRLLVGLLTGEAVEVSMYNTDYVVLKLQAHGTEGELWALATHPTLPQYATGGDDGVVRIWDSTGKKQIISRFLDAPIRAITYSHDATMIAAGCGSPAHSSVASGAGVLTVLDAATLNEIYRAQVASTWICELKFAGDGSVLAVAAADGTVYMLDAQDSFLERGLSKGPSMCTHIDFTEDASYCQLNTANGELVYLSTSTCKRLKLGTAQLKDTPLTTWTSVYGWVVQGVWGRTPEGVDIVACDRSGDASMLACADDCGRLRLYNYPCIDRSSLYNAYRGHSSSIGCCRWTYKDTQLITVGATDRCVFQWAVVFEPPEAATTPAPDEAVFTADYHPLDRSMEDTLLLQELPPANSSLDVSSMKDTATTRHKGHDGVEFAEPLPVPAIPKGLPESDELILEHVHGIRVHDTRSSLGCLANGGVVFIVAALAVVQDYDTSRQRFYRGHTNEVLSLAVHPDGHTVATGQAGCVPEVHVWDSVTLTPVSILSGFHRVGISMLLFVADGTRLVSAGQDAFNSLAVYDYRAAANCPLGLDTELGNSTPTATGGLEPILARWLDDRRMFTEREPARITSFKHQGLVGTAQTSRSPILGISASLDGQQICVVGRGFVRFWSSTLNTEGVPARFDHKSGDPSHTFTCAVYVDNQRVVIGTTSGDLLLWTGVHLTRTFRAHKKGGVSALVYVASPSMLMSAGSDGVILMWDSHTFASLSTFSLSDWRELQPPIAGVTKHLPREFLAIRSLCRRPHDGALVFTTRAAEVLAWSPESNDVRALVQGHYQNDVWAVATHPLLNVFATAGDDKVVRMWDGATRTLLCMRIMESSMRALAYSPDGKLLVAGFGGGDKGDERGSFVVMDAETLEVTYKETEFPCGDVVRDITFSPDGSLMAVASDDLLIHIYEPVKGFNKRGMCMGHHNSITHLDFSTDGKYLQSASGTIELCYWNARTTKQVRNLSSELREVLWGSWTVPVGWPVQGIHAGAAPSQLSNVDRSKDGKLMVSMDQHGTLCLQGYPCLDHRHTLAYVYHGHGGLKGGRCRWTSQDSHVVTVGGADLCVMQWRHVKARIPPSMAQPAADHADDDVDREYPDRTLLQDALAEGYDLRAITDVGHSNGAHEYVAIKPWLSVITPPSAYSGSNAQLQATGDMPEKPLRLSWVHGFNGHGSRNSVKYTVAGHVLHCNGRVGVVYDPASHTQKHFVRHTDDIISVAVTSDGVYAATGQLGRVPRVYVWHTETLSTMTLLRGRLSKGVCLLCFSTSNSLLACVGLDGEHTVCVYHWQTGALIATGHVGEQKPLCIAWSNDDTTIAVGTATNLTLHTHTRGTRELRRRKGVLGKHYTRQPTLSCQYLPSGLLATGMVDGHVYFWDGPVVKAFIKLHDGPVYTLRNLGASLVSGGGDGRLRMWDAAFNCVELRTFEGARVKSVDVNLARSVIAATDDGNIFEMGCDVGESTSKVITTGHARGGILSLATHPTESSEFITGGQDGRLCVGDVHQRIWLRHKVLEGPVTAVAYSPDGALVAVAVGSTASKGNDGALVESNGTVLLLTYTTFEVVFRDTRMDGWMRDMRFSSDGSILAAACDDKNVCIYEAAKKTYAYKCTCKGHAGAITHVDLTTDGRFLQSNSAAHELLYWSTATGKQLPMGNVELRDARWSTWTCTMGWPVQGLYPEMPDAVDVTAVDRSHGGKLLAAADDHGRIRVYTYPCIKNEALCSVYRGHSMRITSCRWTANDDALISIGAEDQGVFVWEVVSEERGDEPWYDRASTITTTPSLRSGSSRIPSTRRAMAE